MQSYDNVDFNVFFLMNKKYDTYVIGVYTKICKIVDSDPSKRNLNFVLVNCFLTNLLIVLFKKIHKFYSILIGKILVFLIYIKLYFKLN